jgi:hypothetical protein
VRALAGGDACDLPRGAIGAAHLRRAMENLANGCTEFGLAERFAESIERIGRALSWPPVPVIVANVTRERLRRGDVSPADIAAAEACNRHDRELFEFARALFDKRSRPSGVA